MPKNAIYAFRRRLGITKAELARRAKTSPQQIGRLEDGKRKLTLEWASVLAKALSCQASDLMFPENARLADSSVYRNVFLVDEEDTGEHAISFHLAILKGLETIPSDRLELYKVETNDISRTAGKGDFLLVDRDNITVTGPGVYLIDISGVRSWRYLSPSASGHAIIVHSDNDQMAPETIAEGSLTILGRACAKLASL